MASVGLKADAPNGTKTKRATGDRHDVSAAQGSSDSGESVLARLVGYRLAGEVVLEYEVAFGHGAGESRKVRTAIRFPSETRSLLEHLPWADRPTILEVLDRVARRSLADRWASDVHDTGVSADLPDPRRASIDVLSMTLRSELLSGLARPREERTSLGIHYGTRG